MKGSKILKKGMAIFLVLIMLFPSNIVTAAEIEECDTSIEASLNEQKVNMRVGKTKQLTSKASSEHIQWKSSKNSVATVDQNGVVKAIKPGKATISVCGDNLCGNLECEVYVSKKITQKQARKTLLSLKKKYKEGMTWTNEKNRYYWEANKILCFGCIAFAGKVSDKIFGKYAPVKTHKNFNNIKVGDHVRIGGYHSVIVINKTKSSITVAEGNYNRSVHWGRKITKTELKKQGFYVDTRY